MSGGPCGLVVVDKPPGPTSHDVVARLRRALRERRVGHAGTLDPPATGVLLVGVGRATRLLRFLQATDKAYDGTLQLGVATDTLDAAGQVVGRVDMAHVRPEDVQRGAHALTGELQQRPPMVSAVKVDGRRLHELAREGREVERAARTVRVERFEVAPLGGGCYRFEVACGPGTYVRVLVEDLGHALGGLAHVTALRRTRSGRFSLSEAVALDALERDAEGALRDPLEMVAHLGVLDVDEAEASDLVHGRRVACDGQVHGEVAVRGVDGRLVGVALADAGWLRPSVVLAGGAAAGDG